LYTSGSTGTPKGVSITHANIVHYTCAILRVLDDGAVSETSGRRYAMISTLAADLGNTSLYPALLTGATLHVLDKATGTDPERFAAYMQAHRIDVLKITPNHLLAITGDRQGAELQAVLPAEWLVLGGEALRPEHARALLAASRCRVLNHYGPTETTVGACTFEATSTSLDAAATQCAQTVPVGRPLAGVQAYVLDQYGNEQAPGLSGELVIAGAGVADGYFRRPDLTNERFTDYRGSRAYRTGDRVRRLADGTIEFQGRLDNQVKVQGFRVELGEIEQVLRAHPGVDAAVVVLRADPAGESQIVGYAVPRAGYAVSHAGRATAEGLREWLATQVPMYMVPEVVILDRLPLTPNGKIDRVGLAARNDNAPGENVHVAPHTPTEEQLASIWQDVLKLERIRVKANFLALGGHSLLAIRILGRVSKLFGVRLALRTLFEAPTIEQLAAAIDEASAAGGGMTNAPSIVGRSRDAHRIALGTDTPTGPGKAQ
jgi:amino acid adenylation domain-containing protein